MDNETPIACPDHPQYKGKSKPKRDEPCETCDAMYEAVQRGETLNPLDELDPSAIDTMMEKGYKKATKADLRKLVKFWRGKRAAYEAEQEAKGK